MVNLTRFLKHTFSFLSLGRNPFPQRVLHSIETTIEESEKKHGGEIRFVVENTLSPGDVLNGTTAHQRALELFSILRVWDTEHNNGVLLYLLLADKEVEIVADRGLNGRVTPDQWESVCRSMETHFRTGQFEEGTRTGLAQITHLLATHFPPPTQKPNEISNTPVVL